MFGHFYPMFFYTYLISAQPFPLCRHSRWFQANRSILNILQEHLMSRVTTSRGWVNFYTSTRRTATGRTRTKSCKICAGKGDAVDTTPPPRCAAPSSLLDRREFTLRVSEHAERKLLPNYRRGWRQSGDWSESRWWVNMRVKEEHMDCPLSSVKKKMNALHQEYFSSRQV